MVYGCSVVTSWRVSVLPQELQKHRSYRTHPVFELGIFPTVRNVSVTVNLHPNHHDGTRKINTRTLVMTCICRWKQISCKLKCESEGYDYPVPIRYETFVFLRIWCRRSLSCLPRATCHSGYLQSWVEWMNPTFCNIENLPRSSRLTKSLFAEMRWTIQGSNS
jgi:hypothetical protein